MLRIAGALLYQKTRARSVLLVPLRGLALQHARLLNKAGVTARSLSGSRTAAYRVELRQLLQERQLQALVLSPEALCHRDSLLRALNERQGGITAFEEAHLWTDAAHWSPTLTLASTRLQGRRQLSLTGSLRIGKEAQLADALRMSVAVASRGVFARRSLIMRIKPRPPASCPPLSRVRMQEATREEWWWRVAYVNSMIVVARQKNGNAIIYAHTQHLVEHQVFALKEMVSRRVARVGGPLPSVYSYQAG